MKKRRVDAGLHPAYTRIRMELCACRKNDGQAQVYLSRSLRIKLMFMSFTEVVRTLRRTFNSLGFKLPKIDTANLRAKEKRARERMYLDMPEELRRRL